MKPTIELGRHAVLVHLRIHMWSGAATDRKISDEVAANHKAEKTAGRYIKQLAAQHHLASLRKFARETRQYLHRKSLPWDRYGEGTRLLPVKSQAEVCDELERRSEAIAKKRNRLLKDYDNLKAEARVRLGGMYNENDYPSREEISRAIWMEWSLVPVPERHHFAFTAVVEDEVKRMAAKIEQDVAESFNTATQSLFERLSKLCSTAIARLDTEEDSDELKIFRNSLLGNIREGIDAVRELNLAGDERLEAATERLDKLLSETTIDDLRPSRTRTAAEATIERKKVVREMQNVMAGYLG